VDSLDGNNGQNNVVSYVQSGLTGLTFDVKSFINDTSGAVRSTARRRPQVLD